MADAIRLRVEHGDGFVAVAHDRSPVRIGASLPCSLLFPLGHVDAFEHDMVMLVTDPMLDERPPAIIAHSHDGVSVGQCRQLDQGSQALPVLGMDKSEVGMRVLDRRRGHDDVGEDMRLGQRRSVRNGGVHSGGVHSGGVHGGGVHSGRTPPGPEGRDVDIGNDERH